MKKMIKASIVSICLLTLTTQAALAQAPVATKTLEAYYPEIKTVVSGQEVTLKDGLGETIAPFIVDGTMYLPVRAVSDVLGKSVEWDAQTNTVYIGKAPLEEDALQLIHILEQTHPAFALDKVPSGYQAAKEALMSKAKDPACTLADFTWAAMAYTASMEDEHTRIDPFGNTTQASVDIGWVADGDKLYLTGDDGAMTNVTVTAVGGVPIKQLFAVIDQYVASENQAGRDINHAQWAASPALLIKAGVNYSEDNTMVLSLEDGGKVSTKTVGLTMAESQGDQHVITTEMMGEVLYVDFNQCTDGDELQQAVATLKKAVQSGTSKVIIDVRGNGGGNSNTCVQLLQALGMEVPSYGVYIRYSPLAQGTYPDSYDQNSGGDRYEPQPELAKANPAVQLVVLTDENTFSSATMLAVYVRDGQLGTIVGRPSSNAPNSYGDILAVRLENTRIYCTFSHKQWLRPDQSAEGNAVIPDIVTAVGEDALQTALIFLTQQ